MNIGLALDLANGINYCTERLIGAAVHACLATDPILNWQILYIMCVPIVYCIVGITV